MAAVGDSITTCTSEQLNSIAPNLERFLVEAFDGDFSRDDFEHCLGGRHFLIVREGGLVAHAAVVARQIILEDQPLMAGYLEGFAVEVSRRRRGLGSQLLTELTRFCRQNYQISMLSTDVHDFYERRGWQRFEGQSFVVTDTTVIRTVDDDQGLMLLGDDAAQVKPSRVICDFRLGDVW